MESCMPYTPPTYDGAVSTSGVGLQFAPGLVCIVASQAFQSFAELAGFYFRHVNTQLVDVFFLQVS